MSFLCMGRSAYQDIAGFRKNALFRSAFGLEYAPPTCEQPETIIALYHDYRTSEQFHSELKIDMDVERLPSGSMKVNELVLMISMLAFNTLRFIGQRALAKIELLPAPPVVARKRLREVIFDLILIGCKLVRHDRQMILRVRNGNPWLPVFDGWLYTEFLGL